MGRTAHHAAAAFDLSLSLSLSLSLVRLLARRLVAASAHRSLLVALELLGLSRLCLSFVCFLYSTTSSPLIGGFGGLGRHWRASLVVEISLSRLED